MSKPLAVLVSMCLLASPVLAAEPASQAPSADDASRVLAQFRDDLQAAETEIVSKVVTLSTDEATAFWPVFKRFQTEQKAIIDGQAEAVRNYAANYETLSDDDATAYVQALLDRDQRIHDLRAKYLVEFAKVIPVNKAARVIHISRRLGMAAQTRLADAIPLVH